MSSSDDAIYSDTLFTHGVVELIDIMPVPGVGELDDAVVQMARVSYQAGTTKKRNTEGLINYLMAHQHWSPFEGVELKFRIRAPIFVLRQWHRHRSHSLNEESARYSVVRDEYFLPRAVRVQDTKNKQGSLSGKLDKHDERSMIEAMEEHMQKSMELYHQLLGGVSTDQPGAAREQARIVLPQAMFSSMIWKTNLRNFFHFTHLRTDTHAQEEIRAYAHSMYEMVKPLAPLSCDAFERYMADAVTVSGPTVAALLAYFGSEDKMRAALHDAAGGQHEKDINRDVEKLIGYKGWREWDRRGS